MLARHGIRIEPNPVAEGQFVTITVAGKGPWYVGTDPAGELTEVTPDANGEIEIRAPGRAGDTYTITNSSEPFTSAFGSISAP
jgi:hypothetical protein